MALPIKLNDIFKNKQKSYKMALILCLTVEGMHEVQAGVMLDKLASRFRAHYIQREQAGLPYDKPPTYMGDTWINLTEGQVRTLMQNPIQALKSVLVINPEGTLSMSPELAEQLNELLLHELREYAKRAEEDYYQSPHSEDIPIRDYLLQVMDNYVVARRQPIKEHPIDRLVRKTIPDELRKLPFIQSPYIVQGSVGKGNWAAIPWIAVLNSELTTSIQSGEYLVYLFAEDMSSVYLTFAQGVTEHLKLGKKEAYQYFERKVEEIRELIPLEGAQKDKNIYLTSNSLGNAYSASTIAYYRYDKATMPSDEQLLADLKSMVENYALYAEKRQVAVSVESHSAPVFKYSISYLHYVNGLVAYLNDSYVDPEQPTPFSALLEESIQTKLFKSGEKIKHPENRLRDFIRVLSELGIVQEEARSLMLTEFGRGYAAGFQSDGVWIIQGEQAAMLRNMIEDQATISELPLVIRNAARIAEEKQIFSVAEFQEAFIEVMEAGHYEEETKKSRTRFMLNWLTELRYIRKGDDGMYSYVGEETEVYPVIDHMSVQERISHIKAYIANQGFSYPDHLIENFFLSLKTKPFVILAGISGTGKTKLVKLFAEALGATTHNQQFRLIPVRPDWSDPSDLIGYQDLAGQFRPGPLTEVLVEAQQSANRSKPYFICLDEMNLARVEHYFSDMLSILETQRREGDRIVTDSIVRKELLQTSSKLQLEDELVFPDNVFLVGTVNMDETTHPFSKKVLDRANTLEFNYIRLDDFPVNSISSTEASQVSVPVSFLRTDYLALQDAFGEYEGLIRRTTEQLVRVNGMLEEIHAHIGFRVRDAVCFYMIYNNRFELLDEDEAFDMQLLQKILPRIQGSSLAVKRVIIALLQYCNGKSRGTMDELLNDASELYKSWRNYSETPEAKYPQSARKLAYMLRRLEEDGFTSFWLS